MVTPLGGCSGAVASPFSAASSYSLFVLAMRMRLAFFELQVDFVVERADRLRGVHIHLEL
jgi:hypothetical protein